MKRAASLSHRQYCKSPPLPTTETTALQQSVEGPMRHGTTLPTITSCPMASAAEVQSLRVGRPDFSDRKGPGSFEMVASGVGLGLGAVVERSGLGLGGADFTSVSTATLGDSASGQNSLKVNGTSKPFPTQVLIRPSTSMPNFLASSVMNLAASGSHRHSSRDPPAPSRLEALPQQPFVAPKKHPARDEVRACWPISSAAAMHSACVGIDGADDGTADGTSEDGTLSPSAGPPAGGQVSLSL
mmetsp:Transcript_29197/g.82376  ORF Transcript_29197/g.82376 Transcript_29197/m.82376 type:complete len:242 (+) Transcript_29197:1135-1860(+)